MFMTGLLTLTACQLAHANAYVASGTVVNIYTNDLNWFGANTDWFDVSGVTSLGTCGTSQGYVVFRIRDDVRGQRMFAGLTAAKLAGNSITVSVDEQDKDSTGFCFAQWISF
jgi:hypothetical protein